MARSAQQNHPHSVKYCYSKTPMETFIESLPLAQISSWITKMKQLNSIKKVF
jgi:hypothetical protein